MSLNYLSQLSDFSPLFFFSFFFSFSHITFFSFNPPIRLFFLFLIFLLFFSFLGRILNRFSSDMVVVDEELSQTISQLTNSLFACLGAVGAIAGATQGTFLILCVPLVFLYEKIQRYFRKSNTAIARLQSVSLSPIYADFSQALTGEKIHCSIF